MTEGGRAQQDQGPKTAPVAVGIRSTAACTNCPIGDSLSHLRGSWPSGESWRPATGPGGCEGGDKLDLVAERGGCYYIQPEWVTQQLNVYVLIGSLS